MQSLFRVQTVQKCSVQKCHNWNVLPEETIQHTCSYRIEWMNTRVLWRLTNHINQRRQCHCFMFTQHHDLFQSRHWGKTEVAFDIETRPTMAEIMTRGLRNLCSHKLASVRHWVVNFWPSNVVKHGSLLSEYLSICLSVRIDLRVWRPCPINVSLPHLR